MIKMSKMMMAMRGVREIKGEKGGVEELKGEGE